MATAPRIIGSPADWINPGSDYPAIARRVNLEGTTGFELTVGKDGHVIACDVTQSSGHDILDHATCDLLSKRATFRPAADSSGLPMTGTWRSRVVWRLSDFDGTRLSDSIQRVTFDLQGDDSTSNCKTEAIGNWPHEDMDGCQSLSGTAPAFAAALRAGSNAETQHIVMETGFALSDDVQAAHMAERDGWDRVALLALRFRLTEGGTVADCTIYETRGDPGFVTPRCTLLAMWKYQPFRDKDGKAVARQVGMTFVILRQDAAP